MSKILVADDEKNIREGIATYLEDEGYFVFTASDGEEALETIENENLDVIISDLRMPQISGEKLLKIVKEKNLKIPFIILTAHGTVDSAVDAMREGAYDFLTKPLDLERLLLIIKRSLNKKENNNEENVNLENILIRKDLKYYEKIIGKSLLMQKIFELVIKIAKSNASVLITGESGVGKEIIADAIFDLSNRNDKPFIKVNCAALSESILESELFGHEKGAFTGAISKKKGRFELANKGTIFLDEIAEISPEIQVKLLRVLQNKTFERVGGETTIKVDIRLLAATNKNLEEEIKKGKFREDLFYRLNIININIPPLRERKDDISNLTSILIRDVAKENNRQEKTLSNDAIKALYYYDWPGNIRELKNVLESALILSKGKQITKEDLPAKIKNNENLIFKITLPIGISLKEAEKEIIKQTLFHSKNNKSKCAEILKIGRKTLHNKIIEYQIDQ
ncbi:sigma-54-dependent transcriptional regulator [Borreliella garinii]|uniref:sigma-54-dependent transcriptional regulator n=2 Tax=Borreliella garinii TaxID=29519 RepID=UPI00018E260D|nr:MULTISPECIES: sigma-54 dependent transcriptional regulator [Borreliella]EED29877.1 acetoacetate metabolism regulatory protein AtoC (Ornithine/argininedecarboxylase inhibitor) [Borreliella garinii Far04]WNZ66948.1 sigma-54 dependent transcriptional regulator [Borreliella garinii]WNZ67943.1 sigma-54 dependent transcriptional regulator [Borreliella garinii]WNZ68940.1 sigma-54 dependent transcriptional regulator [Borreliella garinii]WNZ69940.1 sigma-54 dependent transcriptional regulator [Borre